MNIYLQKIQEIALPNKYTKWYIHLVESRYDYARTKKDANKIKGYTESHHIWPVSFCQQGVDKTDPINRVHFTAREHFISHWLLKKMFIGTQKSNMCSAFLSMSSRKKDRKLRSFEYEICRKAMADSGPTQSTKDKIGKANKGKVMSEKQKEFLSNLWKGKPISAERRLAMIGKKQSKETIEKRANTLRGVVRGPLSEEHKAKLRCVKRRKRGPYSEEHIKNLRLNHADQSKIRDTCPHCKLEGPKFIIRRNHYSKCKTLRHAQ